MSKRRGPKAGPDGDAVRARTDAPERTPLSTDVLPFKRRIKELEREVAALEQKLASTEGALDAYAREVAALEQGWKRDIENLRRGLHRIKKLRDEVERLRAAIAEALHDTEGEAFNILRRALTEGE